MRHFKLLLALTSLFTLTSSSKEHKRSNGELVALEPWQVTKLSTFSPSGRPGSSPYARLWANITNPASIPAEPGVSFDPSRANCTIEWVWNEEEPYGRTYECDTAEDEPSEPVPSTGMGSGSGSVSKWTIEVLEANSSYPSPTEDMDVKFTLATNLTVDGKGYYEVLEGMQRFSVGGNMRGVCGGSGVVRIFSFDSLSSSMVQVLISFCGSARGV
ncbi:hypothetical protein F5Y06DRAFT_53747 [Hypoxylon sp. FL0890]|nr:hypothetical protein F5Y06DRAFT_53747 [Hypoxylon sp. FL0890]